MRSDSGCRFSLFGCLGGSVLTCYQGSAYKAIATLATAMILFRCDMLVLMAPLVLQLLISKEVTYEEYWYFYLLARLHIDRSHS
jgi:hypothetical protein